MKIAVPTENEEVFQHFGQSRMFTVYETENGKVTTKELLDSSRSGHSALAGLLNLSAVNVVICGGIGGGARDMLKARGIQVVAGIEGRTDDAVKAYLNGELTDAGSTCNHHEHEHGQDHACSCHEHCH
jgi:predicted Fe-Mo cluster-binding NifX family protein